MNKYILYIYLLLSVFIRGSCKHMCACPHASDFILAIRFISFPAQLYNKYIYMSEEMQLQTMCICGSSLYISSGMCVCVWGNVYAMYAFVERAFVIAHHMCLFSIQWQTIYGN